ncbi:hypothetical protein ACE6H2_019602 [Prunus campanulata]
MLKMMMRNIAASSSSSSYCTSKRWRGMPCLHSNSTVVVFANDYFAFLHSQPSKPIKSTRTQLEQPVRNSPKITTVEDAFNVFDGMLQMRPPPSVVRFNQILGQVAKLKHYSAVISLYNQMGASVIGPGVCTLNILINCYCHLNQMGFSLSVLGNFFKLGLEPDVFTFNTLSNGFLLKNRVAEAAALLHKMMRGGNCQPDVVTLNILINCYCHLNQMGFSLSVLGNFFKLGLEPDVLTFTTLIDGFLFENRVVEAAALLHKMMRGGNCQLDVVTFGTLVKGFCMKGGENAFSLASLISGISSV